MAIEIGSNAYVMTCKVCSELFTTTRPNESYCSERCRMYDRLSGKNNDYLERLAHQNYVDPRMSKLSRVAGTVLWERASRSTAKIVVDEAIKQGMTDAEAPF